MKALFLSLVCFLFIVNALRAQEMPRNPTMEQISRALKYEPPAQDMPRGPTDEALARAMAQAIRESKYKPTEWGWQDTLRSMLPYVVYVVVGGIGAGGVAILRGRSEKKRFIRAPEVRQNRPVGNRWGEHRAYTIGPDGKVWMVGDGPSKASGVEQASIILAAGQACPVCRREKRAVRCDCCRKLWLCHRCNREGRSRTCDGCADMLTKND
jgi:hypothetical protein